MDVRLRYFEDCLNWRLAEDRLREAVAAIGDHTTTVADQLVRDEEEADRAGSRGSPTVLVNGRGPFTGPGDRVGFACRLSPRVMHFPSVEQLCAPLSDAR